MDDQNKMHPDDKRNLIVFLILALGIWFLFDTYLMKPKLEALEEAAKQTQQQEEAIAIDVAKSQMAAAVERPRDEVISEVRRIDFDNGYMFGSIALKGGRVDDVSLHNYYETLEKKEHIQLMSPSGTPHPRYMDMGWLATDATVNVPSAQTMWSVQGNNNTLSQDEPVVLFWENGQGLRFERHFKLDDRFLITVEQKVVNHGDSAVSLFPYNLIVAHGLPENLMGRRVVQEGPVGYIGGELYEIPFRKMPKKKSQEVKADDGWIGITEHYWFVGLVPFRENGTETYRFAYAEPKGAGAKEKYQVDITGEVRKVAAGGEAQSAALLFTGPKQLDVISAYGEEHNIRHFDLIIDFGWFYFMTKPLFFLLSFFGDVFGNYGIAIILVTIIIRLAVFPLANKSYRSFAKLREIAPKMKELREKHGEDKQHLQKELVKLYEREKVNPMAGCFPILIQIPIFYAIYKVIQIAIEIRHEPFFGWIQDLTERDPTSVFNLFGLLPYDVPEFLMIGAWPCMMLFFMLLQRQLNPPPQDPMQAAMVKFMPFFITYILSQFAAGLVIYWTFSNAFSVIQQYIIMRMMGVEVHLFSRSKEDREMEEAVSEGPDVHPELGVLEDEVDKALFHEQTEAEQDEQTPKKDIKPPKRKPKKKK